MTRNRNRHRKSEPLSVLKSILGIVLIIAVVSAIIGLFYFQHIESKHRIVINKEDFCPRDETVSQVTAIIVDATDPFNAIQKLGVVNLLDELISEIPRYGALAIYAVSTDESIRSSPVFFRCNPGRGQDIDPIFENPEMVEKQWKEGFRGPLEQEMKKNMESGSANSSPILESIQWVALQQFKREKSAHVVNRLVVISDFIHHTTDYSHYRNRPDFKGFESSNYYKKTRVKLRGSNVALWFVRRNTRVSIESLKKFWQDYLRAQGADEVSVNDLAG